MGTGLYKLLNRGPLAKSYRAKLFVVCLVGLVPVATVGLMLALTDWLSAGAAAGVFAASLIAFVAIIWAGLGALLKPLDLTLHALDDFAARKTVPQLATDGEDVAGQIMGHTQRAIVTMADARSQRAADRTTDPVTGLINERSAVRRLGQDILRAARDSRPVCLALVQIDNLDAMAGEFQADSLNRLISNVSNTIVKALRRSDWVAGHGNHNFMVGLWGVKADAALTALGRVAASLRDHGDPPVTLSIGIAVVKQGDGPDTVIANATNAMYKARTAGGNRVIVEV